MKLLKSLLAVQMCLILTASQAFALAGGPNYDSAASYVGDYSGTMLGAESDFLGESNAVGLFSLGIPQVGLASGPAAIFSNGRVFEGSIQGLASPEGQLTAVINTSFDYTIVATTDSDTGETTATNVSVTATANGNIEANIDADVAATTSNSVNALRISGTAEVSVSGGQINQDGSPTVVDQVTFQVTGFQQSTNQTITAATTIPGLDGN